MLCANKKLKTIITDLHGKLENVFLLSTEFELRTSVFAIVSDVQETHFSVIARNWKYLNFEKLEFFSSLCFSFVGWVLEGKY